MAVALFDNVQTSFPEGSFPGVPRLTNDQLIRGNWPKKPRHSAAWQCKPKAETKHCPPANTALMSMKIAHTSCVSNLRDRKVSEKVYQSETRDLPLASAWWQNQPR